MTTHYDVLGIARTRASAEQIKRAYYRKARAYHPDAHAGSSTSIVAEAERAMASINAAWNVLRDDDLRAEYDRALSTGAVGQGAGRRSRAKDRQPQTPPMMLGVGFHYWMGSLGSYRAGRERPRLNLGVDTATDLSPLLALKPDGLTALHAANAAIGDDQMVHLGELTGLRYLDLSQTKVTDAGLLHLSGLSKLEQLWLWGAAITDAGLALLGRLTSLRLLGLGDTKVTDAGLAGLADLRSLNVLQLSGTEVVGPGLDHLFGLVELERIFLPWRVRPRFRRRLQSAIPRLLIS